jgi:hypothetical protein
MTREKHRAVSSTSDRVAHVLVPVTKPGAPNVSSVRSEARGENIEPAELGKLGATKIQRALKRPAGDDLPERVNRDIR